MAHIHTDPGQHDQTACAYIVRFDTPEPQILIHLHKKLSIWLQPGGHIELTETPWQAVLHEIEEETGYTRAQLTVLQPKQRLKHLSGIVLHPQVVAMNTHKFGDTDHYHTDHIYAFATDQAPERTPRQDESQDLRWIKRQEVADYRGPDMKPDTREMLLYIFDNIVGSWERVDLNEYQA